MAALLAFLTFAVFVFLDYALNHRRAAGVVPAAPEAPPAVLPAVPPSEPVWVAGYQLPGDLHYHPGHTWVRPTGPDTAVVGMDDFARRLLGRADRVSLPKAGAWLPQGGAAFRVASGARTAALVVPVEGEVLEVNGAWEDDPARLAGDPYGRGWLCRIRSGNLAANLRNLLQGSLARHWMEDARERLEVQLMALSGSVLQDGGEPAPDFADHLRPEEWKHLVAEFLRT
jgi:glycine cleavage system H lipoate-binding protein